MKTIGAKVKPLLPVLAACKDAIGGGKSSNFSAAKFDL